MKKTKKEIKDTLRDTKYVVTSSQFEDVVEAMDSKKIEVASRDGLESIQLTPDSGPVILLFQDVVLPPIEEGLYFKFIPGDSGMPHMIAVYSEEEIFGEERISGGTTNTASSDDNSFSAMGNAEITLMGDGQGHYVELFATYLEGDLTWYLTGFGCNVVVE